MDTRTFENIKNKIDALKEKRAKAEGAMESILENWKVEHKISTVEEAEDLLKFMEEKLTDTQNTIDELYEQLKGLTNWGLL